MAAHALYMARMAAIGSAAAARTGYAATAAAGIRTYSAVGGKHNPMDVTRETNAMMHQESTATSGAEAEAFELKVPGVAAFAEPNVPKPGTVQPPNPSPELLEPVPIAKVTHDGDVTAGSIPEAPASGLPRS